MHHPSGAPDDDSGALFGLDALTARPDAADLRPSFRTSAAARRLLPVREIYAEPAAAESPRGRQISARFPDARVTTVESHWRLPGLHGNQGNIERWVRVNPDLLALDPRGRTRIRFSLMPRTHNRDLHEVNLGWHPRAEDVLWRPEPQQAKRSENGALNLRYRNDVKGEAVRTLRTLIDHHAPWLRVRYAF
ncbi:hypothetical protein AB0D62_22225 [Streptomyces massasporeus]|uniref:hypothetical protein n=1 Tax=Streptomyces massasporeus TaxID=67324 RepID=UPI0033D6B629